MNLPSLQQLETDIAALSTRLSDPLVSRNPGQAKQLSRELTLKREVLALAEQLQRLDRERTEAEGLREADDEEMQALAEDDLRRIATETSAAAARLEELLVPADPRDSRDVILEIRAGAGGEEAAIFAAELFRAYSRYAEQHGWRLHTVSSSLSEQNGFKEVVAELEGENVFGTMKFERGVHRVQRVPETEKMGRIHTSTVTVAVLPQAEEVDIEIKPEDLRIDTYRASGAGGQHVNKTSSAIRITHLPTNTVVAVQDERSQHKNKDKAMRILRSRLLEAQEEKQRAGQAQERRQQVGTGDRSEKIRTYNFPQDRITDHRIKESWSNIPEVMEGAFDRIFEKLREEERKLRTAQV